MPALQEHWEDLMDMIMDPKQWKKARDLALLSLASYKGKEKETGSNTETKDDDPDLIAMPGFD
ncbi:hypothetical protein L1047_00380 [Synechococcus sp. Nb3U1]|nr:hypothetical protein [Synechococcus sp. Nb3U1]